jgi:RNA polymerase sigma-70 factor (ECF subfamily)
VQPEPQDVRDQADAPSFQSFVLVHLDAGYNLAFWMLRDEHLASDALQDAALKAWCRFDTYRGGDAKTWWLAIVRTSAIDLARRAGRNAPVSLEASGEPVQAGPHQEPPLSTILRREHAGAVHDAAWSLTDAMREVLVLREVEGLSYAQIAQVLGVPIGTVMSRVSRARDAAAAALRAKFTEEDAHGV